MQLEARLFIHATNVHNGGGAILLHALLVSLPPQLAVIAQLDARMAVPPGLGESTEIRAVNPTLSQRLFAEWWLAKAAGAKDTILCFGNLPPLFKTAGRAVVFVQNRYLIDDVSLNAFPLKARLRLQVERWWLSAKAMNATAFVVQTPSMAAILRASGIARGRPVHVYPFVSMSAGYQRSRAQRAPGAGVDSTFLYVGSGEPHKNHRQLLESWCLLAQEGLFPALWLTLDTRANADLCKWIGEKKIDFGLNIQNLGVQSHDRIRHLYTQVQALIYPSTFESFGLPLIEARQAGLAVVASDLDFVRDVLDPEQVFDPRSPVSIARAVKRFLGAGEEALPLLNATEFMQSILENCE